MRLIRTSAIFAAALLCAGYANAQVSITTEGGAGTSPTKISQLPIAGPLTGTEAIPLVQPGSCVSTAGTCQSNPAAFIAYLKNADAILQWLPALVSGDVLSNNGTSLQWVPQSGGGGSGTVTSVGLTVPAGLSVTGSPITTAGTFSISTALNGVLLGTGSGFSTATASNITGLWSGTCDSTTFLRADGTCQAAGGGGGGSVTSVALTMPSIFGVAGSPITTTGTLGVSLNSQSANLVFASPNGSAGTPAFRALASTDIPTTLNALTSATSLTAVGTITSGAWNGAVVQPLYGGSGEAGLVTGILKANGTSAYSAADSGDVTSLWSGTCNATTYLRADGSCQAPPGSGTVTSVGLSAPSVFSVSGSPVTGIGTLALSFATGQTQNEGLFTPNGAPGALSLRAMVAADLPASITSNTSGNAATATALAATPTQCSGAVATGVASSGNANCTPTPTLGASGTLGSLTMGNATSGTVTLAPVAGALGTVTASLPANTGTVAETNLAQTFSALQTFGTNISIGGVTPSGATGTGNLVFASSPTLATPNIGAATGTSLSVSGQLTSTVATGTAPLVVSSTTNVPNLNASSLNGATFASPGAIGSTVAGTGAFTTLTSSGGFVNSSPGSASTAAAKINGALFTGGTGSTTWPLFFLSQGVSFPSTWSTNGTEFGINGPPSFTGNFLDFHVSGGASVASLSATGGLTVASIVDSGLTAGTSPVCPNGTGGALTTTGCTGGSGITQLTGDVTAGPGSGSQAATVVKVNGAAVPASANCVSTNASSQLAAGCPASTRTVTTSATVASTDMGGQIVMNVTGGGTLTIPAISSTVFANGMTLSVVNYSASTALVSTTPTVNAGGGCVSGTGIPAGDSWQILSNGTTLDCIQTTPTASASAPAFSAITTGTNTTATMTVGSGASIVPSGTGSVTATALTGSPWLHAVGSVTTATPVCQNGMQRTVNTITATGNLTINAPTGCSEGQEVILKIVYSASITYTWNVSYHANASNPGALPTSSGGTAGVDFVSFYDDAANSRFDFMASAPAF